MFDVVEGLTVVGGGVVERRRAEGAVGVALQQVAHRVSDVRGVAETVLEVEVTHGHIFNDLVAGIQIDGDRRRAVRCGAIL